MKKIIVVDYWMDCVRRFFLRLSNKYFIINVHVTIILFLASAYDGAFRYLTQDPLNA